MSEKIKDGGPAFPNTNTLVAADMSPVMHKRQDGMTLRQYAAIRLQVPESGDEWMDNMIRVSLRDELAAKAMQGVIAQACGTALGSDPKYAADYAYAAADAMLAAREAKS